MNLLREMLAEFIATMIFVFIGAGSIVFSHWAGTTNGLVIAVAHGFGIFIAISIAANVSGGHLNPAVTYAIMLRELLGKFSVTPKCLLYIVAQIGGAIAGAGILLGLVQFIDGGVSAIEAVNYGAPMLASKVSFLGGLLIELAFSFILVFVVLRVAVEGKSSWAPFVVGMTVFVLALIGGELTGASMNPARWIGPAILSNALAMQEAYVYIVAPITGGVLATIVNAILCSYSSPKYAKE